MVSVVVAAAMVCEWIMERQAIWVKKTFMCALAEVKVREHRATNPLMTARAWTRRLQGKTLGSFGNFGPKEHAFCLKIYS